MVRRLTQAQYRLLDRVRHGDALRTARQPGAARDFAALRGHQYCLLVTFKRSGEPMPTPVLFALAGERLYFRTEAEVAKVRRLRQNPRVRVGPCNWRGKPLGPMTEGIARLLPAAEEQAAYEALKASYTRGQRLYEGAVDRLPVEVSYVEVVAAET
jgi:PPOX class probable F420-dependent enzyme